MNLHKIVSASIGRVNPFIDGFIGKNEGYIINPDFSRTPNITYYPSKMQVQAVTEDQIQFTSHQGIQGVLRSVYLYGNWTGIVRQDNFGGDILKFNDKVWLITQVMESWLDWTHVIVVEQDNVTASIASNPPPLVAVSVEVL